MNKAIDYITGNSKKTAGQNIPLPISINDIKLKLKYDIITTLPDESLILNYIDAGIRYFENQTNLVIVDTLFDAYFSNFSNYHYNIFDNNDYYNYNQYATNNYIILNEKRNTKQIISIDYIKTDNTNIVLQNTDYRLKLDTCNPKILSNLKTSFPIDYKLDFNNKSYENIVHIQYKAGFSNNINEIPSDIKNFLISYAVYMYEACMSNNKNINDIPFYIKDMISDYITENKNCILNNNYIAI